MKILNLTQHALTPDQIADGAFDAEEAQRDAIRELLTFDGLPDQREIYNRARLLALIAEASKARYAMIGGAPYLMATLERELAAVRVQPLYAFSKRETVEAVGTDGAVTKTSVFKHAGWVEP